jgi:hypothetical protein
MNNNAANAYTHFNGVSSLLKCFRLSCSQKNFLFLLLSLYGSSRAFTADTISIQDYLSWIYYYQFIIPSCSLSSFILSIQRFLGLPLDLHHLGFEGFDLLLPLFFIYYLYACMAIIFNYLAFYIHEIVISSPRYLLYLILL